MEKPKTSYWQSKEQIDFLSAVVEDLKMLRDRQQEHTKLLGAAFLGLITLSFVIGTMIVLTLK